MHVHEVQHYLPIGFSIQRVGMVGVLAAISLLYNVFSLGRTPYRLIWNLVSVGVWTIFAITAVAAVHVTSVGLWAATALPLIVLFTLFALCTEITVIDNKRGDIAEWRKTARSPKKLKAANKWTVTSKFMRNSEEISVWIRRGRNEKYIGTGDPIKDMDQWLNLQIQAEEAARTYNNLGVVMDDS